MAHIVITGANRGIGLGLARRFHTAGHQVTRCARGADADRADGVGRRLDCDVGDDASVAALAQALQGQAVDLLINNAGVMGPDRQTTLEMDFPGYLATLNINTLGPLRVTQALLPHLRASVKPRVAVITSFMGALANPKAGSIAYRTSKAAANKLVQGMAAELAGDGICVVAIHPGWVRTDMGGQGADISVEESASGVFNLLEAVDISGTGRFYYWNGAIAPW